MRILSGVQPTGILHLGNYIGAIQQWKQLQNEYEAFFAVVDLHAITTPQNPKQLKQQILQTAAMYLACGIEPEKAVLFVQSHVPAHTELAWILATQTPMGELERMTQYKDKVKKGKPANVGLFTYPILMAADILLYQPTHVPVGDDQQQHVEFTRNLAERFNNKFGEVFTIPEITKPKAGARIMGLDDPTSKMSKSAKSEYNYIALTDSPETIEKKIKKAVTDSKEGIEFNKEERPAITNLATIYQAVTGKTEKEIQKHFSGKGYGDIKKEIAKAISDFLQPIQNNYNQLLNNSKELEILLQEGSKKANNTANETLNETKKAIGLL